MKKSEHYWLENNQKNKKSNYLDKKKGRGRWLIVNRTGFIERRKRECNQFSNSSELHKWGSHEQKCNAACLYINSYIID